MSSKIEMRTEEKDGKVYIVRKDSNYLHYIKSLLGGLLAYFSVLALLYGVLSFNRPDIIERALENKSALLGLLVGAGSILTVLASRLAALGGATFEKVSSIAEQVKFETPMSKVRQWAMQAATGWEFTPLDEAYKNLSFGTVKEEVGELKDDCFSYGAPSSDTPFEAFTSNILKSLSTYATSSEVTATKLLDKGVAFMAGGLVFYVLAIVIWQIFANFTHPDPHVMYVGMAACSMTFIVVEFLAAWFFKQYRYYVEVSLSCLRVRSVYDRYLLGYYALREFKSDADERVCNKMTDILAEDVSWPDYKKGAANDFNYMVKSMSAAHTSIDKIKGMFEAEKKKIKKPKTDSV